MSPPLPVICILAGGKGTRLGDAAGGRPKPLVEVAGEPFLVHPLRLLARHGATRVVLSVGYRADTFEELLGDGSALGLELSYVHDGPQLLGTAGAVRRCLPELGDEFMVMYGDTYLRIDFGAVWQRFEQSGKAALLTVLRNENRWDKSNSEVRDGAVLVHDKRNPSPQMEWIDYGLSAMRAEALDVAVGEADLAELFKALAVRGQLAAYTATERFYEIGTPAALSEAEAYLKRSVKS